MIYRLILAASLDGSMSRHRQSLSPRLQVSFGTSVQGLVIPLGRAGDVQTLDLPRVTAVARGRFRLVNQ